MADGKILRVLTSEFLPPVEERHNNTVYFVYDKMELHLGKSIYSDPFCIVEEIPQPPVEGMLYITTGGLLQSYIDYSIVTLGSCQTEEEIQKLLEAGTVYFMRAEYRYLDLQTKSIMLPYQNGTYQLSVNLMKCLEIDKNTVIRYDETTGHFEIDGSHNDTELHPNHGYETINTDGIETVIEGNRIYSNLKLVKNDTNILRLLSSGLYANLSQYASNEEFQRLAQLFTNYRVEIESIVDALHTEMDVKGYTTTTEMISEAIVEALEEYKPTIDSLVANYDLIYAQLGYIRDIAISYSDQRVEEVKNEIFNFIDKFKECWAEYDHESNITIDDEIYSPTELKYLANAVQKARNDIKLSRLNPDISGTTVPFSIMLIGDYSEIVPTKEITPPSFNVVSEKSRFIGFTHITVVDPKLNPNNVYYYKFGLSTPGLNEDMVANGTFTRLIDFELNANPGEYITIVEADANRLAVRCNVVIADVRTEVYKGMGILNIAAEAGSHDYTMKLTIEPEKDLSSIYMYSIDPIIPEFYEIAPANFKKIEDINNFDVSEINNKLVVVAECEDVTYRVMKIGTFRAYGDEVINKLLFGTNYGDSPNTTKITVTLPPKSPTSDYYISNEADSTVYNAWIPLDSRWSYWDGVSDAHSEVGKSLAVVECEAGKAKRFGYNPTARVNNTYDYDIDPLSVEYTDYIKNKVTDQKIKAMYYKNYEEGDRWLQYGDTVPNTFTPAAIGENDVFILIFTRDVPLSIIAVIDDDVTKVGKFADKVIPRVEYPEEISMNPYINTNYPTILYPNANISEYLENNYKCYYQVLEDDDFITYYKYEPINPALFSEWDKINNITIEESSNLTIFKLVVVDENNKTVAFGKNFIEYGD